MRVRLVTVLAVIFFACFPSVTSLAATGAPHVAAAALAAPYGDVHHPVLAAARAGPRPYTVRRGDTLFSVARRLSGHASRWPELWLANRGRVRNPDVIRAGMRLDLPRWRKPRPWMSARALAAVPRPPSPAPVRAAAVVHHAVPAVRYHCGDGDGDGFDMPCSGLPGRQAASPAPAAPAAPAQPATVSVPGGGFQSCVIAAESGGNPAAVNASSGAGGLYGFLPSTWQALGYSGLPENAPVSVQNQAFAREYARGGTSAWSPYDGC